MQKKLQIISTKEIHERNHLIRLLFTSSSQSLNYIFAKITSKD